MRLRLTYAGELKGNDSAQKHCLRRAFHKQLKYFWSVHPRLVNSRHHPSADPSKSILLNEWRASQNKVGNYRYVPLVLFGKGGVDCALHILILRSDPPGSIVKSGDLDNRVKTIIDALRQHESAQELTAAAATMPGEDEDPFYCLLQKDEIVSQLTVETDTLLQAVEAAPRPLRSHVRLLITVTLTPYFGGPGPIW